LFIACQVKILVAVMLLLFANLKTNKHRSIVLSKRTTTNFLDIQVVVAAAFAKNPRCRLMMSATDASVLVFHPIWTMLIWTAVAVVV
jgi:hypothetical protein